MRSLKDSKLLGIAQVMYLKDVPVDLHHDPRIAIQIMAAIKFGADWQLKISERNYRNKQQNIVKQLEQDKDITSFSIRGKK